MDTPIGPVAIRKEIVEQQSKMTDRQVADEAFKSIPGFINPEAFAELAHRGLVCRGMFEADIYRLIDKREEANG